jgi:hypothetical protein
MTRPFSTQAAQLPIGNFWTPDRVQALSDRAARLHSVRGLCMNNIIYLVGLVVVVLAILSFLGLR